MRVSCQLSILRQHFNDFQIYGYVNFIASNNNSLKLHLNLIPTRFRFIPAFSRDSFIVQKL